MPNQTTDLTPYLFLAAMIVIGGLVAWVADGLGRKIGKKRLSFMGLRPRYTATLITVGAGVLIPVLTIGAIYALSSEVREWIQKGRGAIEDARAKTAQVAQLDGQVEKLTGQRANLEARVNRLGTRTNELNRKVANQEKELKDVQSDLKLAQSLTKVAQAKVSSLQGKVALADRQIKAKEKELRTKQAQLKQGRAELASLQATYRTASGQLAEINKRNLELDRENADLEKQVKGLKKELEDLQSQKREFESQIESYRESIRTYEDTIKEYNERIGRLAAQAEELGAQLRTNIVASRTRPMIFEASQELARVQLPLSLSPVAARNAYFDLLQRARSVALSKKALNMATSPPAGLTPRQINNRLVSIEEQEESLIRAITSQRTELVLIARSFFNAFEGEYVLLEFVAYRNRLIYPEGKLIIEKRIDGRKSEVEILNQIQDFIGTNVRAQALKDGMIPPSGRTGQLGTIDEAELLELIREARSYNQLVRLQAFAKVNTNAGDQLELSFRVRP